MSLARYSIGIKIFGAFIAMGALIAFLGMAGYAVLASAGKMAVTTFDGPLMAINYARAAQSDFILMEMAELRSEHAGAQERGVIAGEISTLATNFADDLSVAEQRSLNDDEKHLIREIRPLVARWRALRGNTDVPELEKIAQQIDDKFDLLIELNTDHSFVGRRQTVDNVKTYEYLTAGATLLALLFAAAITAFLRSRIVRPLAAAAAVADRIARGELQSAIPRRRRRRDRRPAEIHDGDAGQYPRDDDARDRAAALGREPVDRCAGNLARRRDPGEFRWSYRARQPAIAPIFPRDRRSAW